MASLINPYGKVAEVGHAVDHEKVMARRKTRRRITGIAISSIVLVGVIVGAVVGATQNKHDDNKSGGTDQSIASSVKAVCSVTLYPESCFNSLSPLVISNDVKPQDIFRLSLQVALNELSNISGSLIQKLNISDNNPGLAAALDSCQELLSLALDHLNASLSVQESNLLQDFEDLRTWLSSAGTYQQTCIDGINEFSNSSGQIVSANLKNSTEFTSNSLAIVTSLESVAASIGNLGSIGRRRLLGGSTPSWLSSADRKLLADTKPSQQIKADAVVAKDGSGNYTTIGAALKAIPQKSDKKFVIYVKKGKYVENVRIEKTTWNVVMIGDGKTATIVSGRLNVVDGTPTFQSATFAVFGQGFLARDMGFQNTAGAVKQQAVALLSTADLSVFYRCAFDAFQDTLYTHSNRQFYRECDIYGTVDFIFGNSAVVFQNSRILPRKPILGQQNTLTAQGKMDPNQNTGISIQNCTVAPFGNLSGVSTFLGRPWKNYSTTVFMQSNLGSLIDPKGWLPWIGTMAPDTIFYAEYQNFGPGSVTKNRVNWKGLKLNFTVKSFINGDKWLPGSGVAFKSTL